MLACCAWADARPVVAMLTDFGTENEAVGLCHGAILSINSDIQIVDLSHSVDAYDISLAGMILQRTQTFPKGTVFVCVVDPGVGTKREPIALRTKAGYIFVGPNNGMFSWVVRQQGVESVVRLNERQVNPMWKPGTFDGRDLFSPAGALIANSNGNLSSVGAAMPIDKVIALPIDSAVVDAKTGTVSGAFVREDKPYGNMWTNISDDDLTSAGIAVGDSIEVTVGERKIVTPFVVSFGYVKEGETLAYVGSGGTLALAINMGNFMKDFAVKPGDKIVVRKQ
jgi:S-adenosylmethionine hydrolase